VGVVRIGVLGGTFNPVHNGHLHIARNVQELFALSQVHFVVATTPPHKSPEDLIPFNHRYAMVSLAVADINSFIPSLVELEPQASPFSIDTMGKIARGLGVNGNSLYFVAGGDSLLEVKSWQDGEKLLSSYNFVFVVRPGIDRMVPEDALPPKVLHRVRDFTGLKRVQMRRCIAEEIDAETRIYIVDIGAPDISATRIRDLATVQKSIQRLVPQPVRKYIRKLHLYGGR
jgi:nicotinate-nucleotide adenylyltransferase